MKLHLVAQDRNTHRLCHEVFDEILGREWTLHVATKNSIECEADLYLWDVTSDTVTFRSFEPREEWRHFFLVDRSDYLRFQESLPFQKANVLLKPVTKATLTAFVTEACAKCKQQPIPDGEESVEALRADRDEILQCLIQTNLKLQEYDHERTNFLARAIHDFRSPLTAVTGYCGLLLGEDIGQLTGEQREVLERMHYSAKKLSRMASAMFQISIAPRMEVTLDLQRGEIRDCIEHSLHEVLPAAEERRVSISVDTEPTPEPLYFERSKLEQVLVNLLENACKFVPRGGRIEIKGYPYFWDRPSPERSTASPATAERGGRGDLANCYRVDIRDSGPGIPPTHLNKIFEEYTSYAGGGDRSGGGLGLAICRMILNQHRGRIWAESSEEGAVFSFVLPFLRSESNTKKVKTGPLDAKVF